MPLFSFDVEGRSPLVLQLKAVTHPAWVVGWDVYGDGPQGETTRPILYRPSTPGVGRASKEAAYAVVLDTDEPANPNTEITSLFAVLPSPPVPGARFSADLPFRSSAQGLSVLLNPGEAIVLYANTDFEGSRGETTDETARVHLWHGSIQWEE